MYTLNNPITYLQAFDDVSIPILNCICISVYM